MTRNEIYLRSIQKLFELRETLNQPEIKLKINEIIKTLVSKRNLERFDFDNFIETALLQKEKRTLPLNRIKNKVLFQRLYAANPILKSYLKSLASEYDPRVSFVGYVKGYFVSIKHPDASYFEKEARKVEASFNRDIKLARKDYDRALACKDLHNRVIALINGLLDPKCRLGSDISVLYVKTLIRNLNI